MADENDNQPKNNDGQPGKASDGSRGPRIPRGLPYVLVLLALVCLLVSLWGNDGRSYKKITFHDFQTFWNADLGKYEHFRKAELADENLLVMAEDQEWAKEFVMGKATTIRPPLPKAAIAVPKADPVGDAPAKAAAKKEPKVADTTKPVAAVDPDKPGTLIEVAKPADPTKAPPKAERPFSLYPPPEYWFRVSIPKQVLDADFFKQLGTIPEFASEPASQVMPNVMMNLIWIAMLLFLVYLAFVFLVRNQNGPGNVLAFGRSRPRMFQKENTRIRFTDVAGVDEAKEEVVEVIEFLKDPRKFERLGGHIPRGILFVGPPGTGKTLMAKAIAGEASVPFFGISGSDFVEMFVGVGASRVRDLFRQARENAPCIIFLDEIDAVGRRRGGGHGNSHEEREQTLNAILVEMDGFDSNEQVIVIAATNRPDVLDPALLRPGRFDREVVISLPDVRGRFEILKVHSRKVKMSADVDLTTIARGTPMFSGAQLMSLINEAAIRATMLGKEFVGDEDLEEARDKVWFGRQRRSRELDEQDRKQTAYHEAGHAVLSLFTPDAEPLHKVTIIPRGMALGLSMSLPAKDHVTMSKRQMLAHIRVCMGGRIAEEMFFGEYNSGARSDIEKATALARQMVCEYGMSDELGPIRYAVSDGNEFLGGEMALSREYSGETARKIDAEIRQIIDRCYQDAKATIEQHKEDLDLLANALLKHETIAASEIKLLFETRSIDSIGDLPPVADGTPEAEITIAPTPTVETG